MSTGGVDDVELTFGLARALVAEVSPAELEVFDLLFEGYRDEPRSIRRGDGALGFGTDIVTAAVVAVPVAQVVTAVLLAAAQDLLKDGGVAGVKTLLRRWLHHEPEVPQVGPVGVVPADVLARARDAAVNQAMLMGLTADRAELLGNAVAGVLGASG